MQTLAKERPILFNASSVQAILNKTKTQTRRVVKPPAPFDCCDDGLDLQWAIGNIKCPYGQPGDILWVKESWRPRSWSSDFDWMMIEYAADEHMNGRPKQIDPHEVFGDNANCFWEALAQQCVKAECPQSGSGDFVLQGKDGQFPIKWKLSRFMPRKVSRITLQVKSVRVERVKDISEEDAIAEGIQYFPELPSIHPWGQDPRWGFGQPISTDYCLASARAAFGNLWDSINGKTYPWCDNPWVFVIDFEEIENVGGAV